jgi:hypothetical protein
MSSTLVTMPSSSAQLGETTARFVASADEENSASVVLVYDLRVQGWSVDSVSALGGPAYSIGGAWGDRYIASRVDSNGALVGLTQDSVTSYADNGDFISTRLGTGDLRPFGVGGYGSFMGLVLVGEYRADCNVNIAVSVDGRAPDVFTFPVTAADEVDGSVYFEVTPQYQKGAAIRVTCYDSAIDGTATEGVVMQALFLEYETIGKTKRLAAARRG